MLRVVQTAACVCAFWACFAFLALPPVLPLQPECPCSVLCRHTALQKCFFPRIFMRVHSPLEDCAANIMHGVQPGQTELVGYTENEVLGHMLAPIQEL